MHITLLRHAPTPGNLQKRYVGRIDEPLSEEGVAYAQSFEPNTSVARVFTSGLERTKQTAGLLFPQAQIIPLAGLNEMDFGDFEGRTAAEMEFDSTYRAWVEGGCKSTCPGGEDMSSFTERCVAAFLEVISSAARDNSESETFVIHGGTIMAIMSTLALPIKPQIHWMTTNCGGFVVVYDQTEHERRPLQLHESIRRSR